MKKGMPWLVLVGSGGVANLVGDILENPLVSTGGGETKSEAGSGGDLKERLAERVRKHLPSETDTDKLTERVGDMVGDHQKIYRNLDPVQSWL